MRKFESLPQHIQVAINGKERCEKARELASNEKHDDTFYQGKATDNTFNFDKKEINSFMELL